MKLNAFEIAKQIAKFGYLNDTYAMDLDPSFTYQEFLLVKYIREIGIDTSIFDPDECITNCDDETKKYNLEIWNKYFVASKYNEAIIDKPWNEVLKDKNSLRFDRTTRKKII